MKLIQELLTMSTVSESMSLNVDNPFPPEHMKYSQNSSALLSLIPMMNILMTAEFVQRKLKEYTQFNGERGKYLIADTFVVRESKKSEFDLYDSEIIHTLKLDEKKIENQSLKLPISA